MGNPDGDRRKPLTTGVWGVRKALGRGPGDEFPGAVDLLAILDPVRF